MKKIFFALTVVAFALTASAQRMTIVSGSEEKLSISPKEIDKITFDNLDPTTSLEEALKPKGGGPQNVNGTWCSIGTSITWYNDHPDVSGKLPDNSGYLFSRGYQSRVMDQIIFTKLLNVGHNGGVISQSINLPVKADYYSIEHGINDWGHSIPVGTIEDYKNNTNNGTFAASYRKLIDNIFSLNPNAKVVLCTPRKGFGFNGYLPAHWYDPKDGIYLQEYADLIIQIAEYESFPVADFFYECGGQTVLPQLSIDVALHPNDAGYQMMANVLIKAFQKVITD